MPAEAEMVTPSEVPVPVYPREASVASDGAAREATPPTDSAQYVYAIGSVELRSPGLAAEKELAQVTGQANVAGLTDSQALASVLQDRQNRYLARQFSWVFTIEGVETYILTPRDPADLDLLVGSVRSTPSSADVDVVVGVLGPIAPPEAANGLMVPIVVFDQLYSFDTDALISSIPQPKGVKAEEFKPAAEELYRRLTLLADNAGATDEHRALNYLTVRYPNIYEAAADAYGRNFSLTSVEARPSYLNSVRRIVEVVFSFTNRQTDVVESSFVRVDVTEEFPFLVSKLAPYLRH
jgi:hypothetical protein